MYHDHHIHPFGYATLVNGLELMNAANMDEVLERIRDRAARFDGPVIGQRLNDEGLSELRLPSAADIDDVVSERPVILYRYCGHIAVANSEAMRLAGIDVDTPDPPGGSIDRGADGRPTGVLRETAVPLASSAIPVPPPADQDLVAAMHRLVEMGIGSITGIVSVNEPIWCGVQDELGTLLRIAEDIPIDILTLVIADSPHELAAAAKRIRETEGRVRFHGWKDFADGSLGGHTAAMYEPFSDRPDTRGLNRLDVAHAIQMGQASIDLGGVVAIHAIGDRANDSVIGVHSRLIDAGADPSSLRIEHASILTDRSIEQIGSLGLTASVQPAFLVSEETWLQKRLGDDRMSRAYPFRSLLESGATVIGGSDSPVELPDPAVGIAAAVDRHGINVSEALTPQAAGALFAPPQI